MTILFMKCISNNSKKKIIFIKITYDFLTYNKII